MTYMCMEEHNYPYRRPHIIIIKKGHRDHSHNDNDDAISFMISQTRSGSAPSCKTFGWEEGERRPKDWHCCMCQVITMILSDDKDKDDDKDDNDDNADDTEW